MRLLLIFLLSGTLALAQSTQFTSATPDADWFTPSNWSNGVPTAGMAAYLYNNSGVLLTSGSGAAGYVGVGLPGLSNHLTISGTSAFLTAESIDVSNTLNINGGATVVSTGVSSGAFGFSSTAAIHVADAGTTWTLAGELNIGFLGAMTVSGGAQVSSATGLIGHYNQPGSGSVTVTGPGSRWNNSGILALSYSPHDSVHRLTVADGGVVSAEWIVLDGPHQIHLGSGGVAGTLDTAEVWGATGSLITANFTGQSTLAAILSAEVGLTKLGSGTLTLSGSNTTSGTFSINEGEILLDHADAASVAHVSLNRDGGLRFGSALTNASIGALSGTGSLDLTNTAADSVDLTVGLNALETTYSGVLSGGGSLTKVGAGVLTLSGQNSYSGGTTISEGTLRVSDDGNLGAPNTSVTILGGYLHTTADITSSRNFTISAGEIFTDEDTDFRISGTLGGTLTKGGLGTLTLLSRASFTGENRILTGTVALDGSGAVVGTGALVVGSLGGEVGQLAITNGATLTSTSGTIGTWDQGLNLGADGVASISGQDSSWTMSGRLVIGDGPGYGVLNVSSGTVSASRITVGNRGLVTQTGGIVISSGTVVTTGTYRLSGGILNLGGVNGSLLLAGGTMQLRNTLTLGAPVLEEGTNSTIDTGVFTGSQTLQMSGAGALTKIGSGTLIFSQQGTYTGGTTLREGTLALAANNPLGSGALTFAGDSWLAPLTNSRTLNNAITINTGVTGTVGGSFTMTLNGNISGDGALAKIGATTTNLTGTNFYSGGTYIHAGLVTFNALSLGTGTVFLNTGTLQWRTDNTADISSRLNTSALGGSLDTNGNNVNFAGSVTGTGGITKIGSGTLTLSAHNSYLGNTTLTAGSLRIAHDGALAQSGTLVLNGGSILGDGAARSLDNRLALTASSTIAGASRLDFTGTLASTGNFTLAVANTGTTTLGGATLSNNATARTLTLNVSGGPLIFGGVISNGGSATSGQITKSGVGTLILAADNTYTGLTTISNGTLQIGQGGLVGSVQSGTISNAGTLVFARAGTTTYAGRITGAGTLRQRGTGTLRLTGSSSYTGATVVENGVLLVLGDISDSSGISVESGATLGGTGIVTDVLVKTGATLSPGTSPGLLTIEGDLTFQSGSTLLMEIGGRNSSLFDRLSVSGIFTAGGILNLQLIDDFTPVFGDEFQIFTNGGFSSGNFSSITTNLGGGLSWDTDALASEGVLRVIPEPAPFLLASVGLSVLLLRRRTGWRR